jgi:hypothetical protein
MFALIELVTLIFAGWQATLGMIVAVFLLFAIFG